MASGIACFRSNRRGQLLGAVLLLTAVLALAGCPAPGTVGNAVCLQCHNGVNASDASQFAASPHAAQNCESCHGPGKGHVQNAGIGGTLIVNPALQPFVMNATNCLTCHGTQTDYMNSEHFAKEAARCFDCHDIHKPGAMRLNADDNSLCLACHGVQFPTDEAVTAHTHHSVDPAGTGASRCIGCHMVPTERTGQDDGPHGHAMTPVPPIDSNTGGVPAKPNSCSGTAGCHDGSVVTAPVFNVDDPAQNELIQILWDDWFASKK